MKPPHSFTQKSVISFPVDENGNALVPPVPYENDKDDPSGVASHQKVPTIPGYKAEVEFVDPTDPTSDTIVKYVAEKQQKYQKYLKTRTN